MLHGVQTQLVPAGGGMVFDVKFHDKGIYPFVSHAFAAVDMGEVGLVNVGNVPGTMSHEVGIHGGRVTLDSGRVLRTRLPAAHPAYRRGGGLVCRGPCPHGCR